MPAAPAASVATAAEGNYFTAQFLVIEIIETSVGGLFGSIVILYGERAEILHVAQE